MKPEELRFSPTHEWVHVSSDEEGRAVATMGLSAHAVEALTDLVFIELPQVGRRVQPGESISEIESVKAVSDIYAPVSGEIESVNDALADAVETISQDPYGAGWIARIRMDDDAGLEKLMDYTRYQQQCQEEEC